MNNYAVHFSLMSHSSWAMAEGYGAHLIKHPDLLSDMVVQAKRRSGLPVSVKLRIHDNLKYVHVRMYVYLPLTPPFTLICI